MFIHPAALAQGCPHLARGRWALLQNSDKNRLKLPVSVVFLQLPPNPALNIICSFPWKLVLKIFGLST